MLARHLQPLYHASRSLGRQKCVDLLGIRGSFDLEAVFGEAEASSRLEAIRHAVEARKLRRE